MRRPRPGFAAFPRLVALRVNDLADTDPATVAAAAARRGLPVGVRSRPVGRTTRVLLTPTRAGTVITLERLSTSGWRRGPALRRLTHTLDNLLREVETAAPTPRKPR